jgi:hypothetical protein
MARVLPAVGVSSNTVLRPQRGFIWWPLLVVLGWSLAHVGGSAAWAQNGSADKPEAKFVFQARKRVETKPGSGRYHTRSSGTPNRPPWWSATCGTNTGVPARRAVLPKWRRG